MPERSRSFTDLKIWIQSLITVVIIAVLGYFGATRLAPELPGMGPEAQTGPTLEAYEAGDGTGEATAATAPSEGAESEEEATVEPVEAIAEQATGEGEATTTPMPEMTEEGQAEGVAELASPPPVGESIGDAGAPGARLTAIAQGTLTPPEQGSGDVLERVRARMTAIAQGTVSPGEAADQSAVATPIPTPAPVVAGQPATGSQTAPGNGASAGNVPGIDSIGGVVGPESGARLFAVARGSDAQLFDRPDGEVVADLEAGSAVTALARSDNGLWTLVQSADGVGWVPVEQLLIFGAETLPVLSDLAARADVPVSAQPDVGQPGGSPSIPVQVTPTPTAQAGASTPILGEYIEPVLATVASLNNRLNVRTGPSTDFDIVERVNAGEQFVALARTSLGDWVQIALPESDAGAGWVSTDFVELSGTPDTLPVADAPGADAPPVGLPTPTPSGAGLGMGASADSVDDTIASISAATLSSLLTPPPSTQTTTATGGEVAPAGPTMAGIPESVRVALRAGPGENFAVQAEMLSGSDFLELGRTSDGLWTKIGLLESPGGVGWVRSEELGRSESAVAETQPTGAALPSAEMAQSATPSAALSGSASATVGEPAQDALSGAPAAETGAVAATQSEASVTTEESAESNAIADLLTDTDTGADIGPDTDGVADAEMQTEVESPAESSAEQAVSGAVPFPQLVNATVISEDAPLNVRSGPGLDYEIVEKLPPGVVRAALAQTAAGAWTQIASPNADAGSGWVASEFVALNEMVDETAESSGEEATVDESDMDVAQGPLPTPSPDMGSPLAPVPALKNDAPDGLESALATVITQDAYLNVRTGPDTSYDVIELLAPGAQLSVAEPSAAGDWIQLILNDRGDTGWVAAEYVELSTPYAQLAVAREEPTEWTPSEVTTSEPSTQAFAPDAPQFLPVVGGARSR